MYPYSHFAGKIRKELLIPQRISLLWYATNVAIPCNMTEMLPGNVSNVVKLTIYSCFEKSFGVMPNSSLKYLEKIRGELKPTL